MESASPSNTNKASAAPSSQPNRSFLYPRLYDDQSEGSERSTPSNKTSYYPKIDDGHKDSVTIGYPESGFKAVTISSPPKNSAEHRSEDLNIPLLTEEERQGQHTVEEARSTSSTGSSGFSRSSRFSRATKKHQRLSSIDLARGLILAIMAWDHTKDFLALYVGADGSSPDGTRPVERHSEGWAGPLEMYSGKPGFFFARVVSHLCAPGFAYLMGLGMILFTYSRTRKGWSHGQILRFFLIRGAVLVLLGFVVRACDLVILMDEHKHGDPLAPLIVQDLVSFFQVMTSLGLQMMVVALLLYVLSSARIPLWEDRRRGEKTVWFTLGIQFLIFLGILCVVGNGAAITLLQTGSPASVTPPVETSVLGIIYRFLLIPGPIGLHTMRPSYVAYPLVAWLGLALFGAATGCRMVSDVRKTHQHCLYWGLGLLAAFVLVRNLSVGVINLRGYPLGEGLEFPLIAFFNVCKYPPSLAYDCLTLGINLLALYGLSHIRDVDEKLPARVVITWGQAPLCFYVLHHYLLAAIVVVIRHATGKDKVSIYVCIALWAFIVLPTMYFVCRAFSRFKNSRSLDSVWRFF